MAALQPPSSDEFVKISQVQEQREREYKERLRAARRQRRLDHAGNNTEQDLAQAATVIQKTYRGYRARRQLDGHGLDASTRWITAIREADFRNKIHPQSRGALSMARGTDGDGEEVEQETGPTRPSSGAKQQWKKAAVVAKRAGHTPGGVESDSSQSDPESAGPAEALKRNAQREDALVMKLQYFLEMVDLKHRHGSNLRKYHNVWKQADTKENFFYWLDYGQGRHVELEECSREKLEREQVRYLSREERQYYLVVVDDDGRLCWAKNGARIDTSDKYKDSIHGIVPVDDPTPGFTPTYRSSRTSTPSSSSSSSSSPSPSPSLFHDQSQPPKSPKPSTHPLAKLIPHPGFKSKWIFVCDMSQNLYVGIKASGAFQHSSFMQGSRIHTAGLLRIRRGKLKSLSPLSGHYRPPAGSFRGFIQTLKHRGVDMSAVTVSKTYVVLTGLEMYVATRKRGKRLKDGVLGKVKKGAGPEEEEEEVGIGAREPARSERQISEKERKSDVVQHEEEQREDNRAALKVIEGLKIPVREPAGQHGES